MPKISSGSIWLKVVTPWVLVKCNQISLWGIMSNLSDLLFWESYAADKLDKSVVPLRRQVGENTLEHFYEIYTLAREHFFVYAHSASFTPS